MKCAFRLVRVTALVLRGAGVAALVALPFVLRGATVPGLTTFAHGDVADAAEVNANFSALATAVNTSDARFRQLASEGRRGVWTGGACREFASLAGRPQERRP